MAPRSKKAALQYHTYLFHEGNDSRAYEFMGAHMVKKGKRDGVTFRTWAPEASSVSVIGEFNDWNRDKCPMERLEGANGIWEVWIPNVNQYDAYKFSIEAKSGDILDKADPYAFHAETRPYNASKVYQLEGYEWNDKAWLDYRKANLPYERAVNIYEVHFGSWKMREDGSFYSYREMAEKLVPYAKEMGYTHIELMPITEYPFDGSWGYQVTGYFAATSRYGTPQDFMYFVDKCHQAGLGILMDWVPAHFPKDGHGLIEYDGSYLYEYADPLKREHSEWGTRIFDYGKSEVRSFLMSSAMFWIDQFHVDGLRVDAVASMLYLDYNKQNTGWQKNTYGGRENLEAIEFLRKMNENILSKYPDVMMIAEESTSWPLVTKAGYLGGLGFNFKWNMGWMNDMLEYFSADPFFRHNMHEKITFSFMYAFSENYILPLSHDEVVHGKHSLLDKMPGEYLEKFAGLRTLLGYMIAHPGKKMLFMGSEFGQFTEWAYHRELDWMLLGYESHQELKEYVKQLNLFYLKTRELWENDMDWKGFEWIDHEDSENNIIVFRRAAKDDSDVVVVVNFAPVAHDAYRIGLPEAGTYDEIFTSDSQAFGGTGLKNDKVKTEEKEWHGRKQSAEIAIPPLSILFFRERPGRKKKTPTMKKSGKKVSGAIVKTATRAVVKNAEKSLTKQTEKTVVKTPTKAITESPAKKPAEDSKKIK